MDLLRSDLDALKQAIHSSPVSAITEWSPAPSGVMQALDIERFNLDSQPRDGYLAYWNDHNTPFLLRQSSGVP